MLSGEVLPFPNQKRHEQIAATIVLLKECVKHKDIHKGIQIHVDALRTGLLEKNVYICSNLINLYAKCGALEKARSLFNEIKLHDVVSWNVLISGYVQHGYEQKAIKYFKQMQTNGFVPDAVTYVCILKACASTGDAHKCEELHSQIVKEGLLQKNVFVGSSLVDMYAKCGALAKARRTFKELHVWDVISCTALISGYVQHGHWQDALDFFTEMCVEGFHPNSVTYVCILKACGSLQALIKGEETHKVIVQEGFLEKDVNLGNALVDMYCKCGALLKAQKVFDELVFRDVVTWNVLIAGYTDHGQHNEAIKQYEEMHSKNIIPDVGTFVSILRACGNTRMVEKGKEIHVEIARRGFLERDIAVGTALVDLYAKCGALSEAQTVFDDLPNRNTVSWTEIMVGYAENGQGQKALQYFQQMKQESISPDMMTLVCILKACGGIGVYAKAKELHAVISVTEINTLVGNALVDMYAKCGVNVKAQDVFDELPSHDIVSWTSLISGYAQQGKSAIVCDCFDQLLRDGVEPNLITFTVVLNACSHAGMIAKGQVYFDLMCDRYGIFPTLKHYTCMVDLYGRAGLFNEAICLIKKVPDSDYLPLWMALLGACQKWGNIELGRWAFSHAIQLDPRGKGPYICMINIYAAVGMHEEVKQIEAIRAKNQALINQEYSEPYPGSCSLKYMYDT